MQNRLEEVRKLRGLSRTQLADLVGTTRVTIYRWETQQLTFSVDAITRLAAALRCLPSDIVPILGGIPKLPETPCPLPREEKVVNA